MSSDSDSGDQFFDAEGSSPIKVNRSKIKLSLSNQTSSSLLVKEPVSSVSDQCGNLNQQNPWESEDRSIHIPAPSELDRKEIERKAQENDKRRRKLEEMRRRVQNDEDDSMDVCSQASSQTSSIDSLYMQRLAMSKVGEGDDARSCVSLGKVGRILSGNDNISVNSDSRLTDRASVFSTISAPEINSGKKQLTGLQEPDLVASTKPDRPNELMPPPVAPPRRKRKNKPTLTPQTSLPLCDSQYPDIPSPATTVDKLTKEFEHSLDLKSAVKGLYVVKPQDEEKDRAEGAPDSTDSANNNSVTIEAEEDSSTKQMNMLVRMRTDSGKQLTDLEILEQVTVLNLDTGEQIPLSLAEDRLPRCVNPLSLHIMRLTSEYVSNSSLNKDKESDEDTDDQKKLGNESEELETSRTRTRRFKRLLNRTVNKIKSVADEVKHARHNEESVESSEDELMGETKHSIKFKSANSHKGPYEFDNLKLLQDLTGEHSGAIWTMKFSYCGRLLATAGQDHVLRIWVLRDSYDYFNNMRQKYNVDCKISPSPSQESLMSHQSQEEEKQESEDAKAVFMPKPFFSYKEHTADLLDVSWSKNYFILSSSMDKTVRLWHISRAECLCCFQHIDFVTAIAFHPRDDRYFLSGSLDGKLRLWNIPDKKVALWNELDGQTKLITAANFCQNGKYAVVGSYDGRCIFYKTDQLKYFTQIHVRSTRGKNAKGRKISGIEPIPGEDKILVTSNDSRIRLYDLHHLTLACKYKGYVNLSSQIRASFSHDGKFITSGSENQYVYVWKTQHDYSKFSSARRDRNEYWEGIKAHNVVVTASAFATNPSLIFKQLEKDKLRSEEPEVAQNSNCPTSGYVLVTADFNGAIKVFVTKSKSKVES